MEMLKEKFSATKACIIAAVACALFALIAIPCFANAETGWPGVEHQTIEAGNTATTVVNLKADDTRLSFIAPSVINFAMKANGDFITPDAGTAYVQNLSVMSIRVSNYEVTSDAVAKGVAAANFDAATDTNAYKVKIQPNSGTAVDFAVSQADLAKADWTMAKAGAASSADKLSFTFSDGKMKNIGSGIWGTGYHLQDVVWHVTADVS